MAMENSRIAPAGPWIQNAPLDLIVGCGAWSAPLLLLSYSSLANTPAWAITFYALALFLNYPHYMSTLYRAYHNEADFKKYRIFTVHITGMLLLTVLLSHLRFSLVPWIFTLYLTVSPWHYSGQNYGLFMMFVRRAAGQKGATHIDDDTRQAVYSAFVLSYVILFLNLHSGPSDRLFLSLGIPALPGAIARIALGAAFLAFAGYGLRRLVRLIGWKAMLCPLVLFSTQILWFLVPGLLVLKGMTISQSRYSTGVLALMHSAQYLWITSYYARKESAVEGKRWRPFAYFAALIVGGVALFIPGPWLASYVFRYDFTASFLIFTALVNLHHFILDGALWKLRDGRIATLLLNEGASIGSEEASTDAAGRAWQWMRSRARGPRWARVAFAVGLLILAGVDQTRHAFASHGDDLEALQQAATLVPVDSSVQLRIARGQGQAGDSEAAVAAYERAIAANPSDLATRSEFLNYLIAHRRYEEADAVAKSALARWPNDPDLLVNRGILAAALGQSAEAVASWEKAIAVDHSQTNAHLYLADELEKERQYEAAIPHYTIFLDRQTKNGRKPDPNLILPALMKLARCQVQGQHFDQALEAYDLGRKIAAKSGQPKIESVASVNEAILVSKLDRVGDALHLYQNALRIDQAQKDTPAEAADWRAYGVFLEERDFPRKLSYACLVEAQLLAGPARGSEPELMRVRSDLEHSLGYDASAIRRNPQPLLDQAMQLREK